MKIHEKLSHLEPEQIEDLVERYSNGDEKVSDLVQEFEIDVNPGNLVSLLPPVVHYDLSCPYCEDTLFISKREGRTGYSFAPSMPCCTECGHKNIEPCHCQNCKERAEDIQNEIAERKRGVISDTFYHEGISPPVEDLTLTDAVYLLAIERHFIAEDMESVDPFRDHLVPIAPLFEFQNEIVKHLRAKNIVAISTESSVDAFVFDEGDMSTNEYYPTLVSWEFLPNKTTEEKRNYLKNINVMAKEDCWPDRWEKDVAKIWHNIAKYECLEYFSHLLDQRGFKLDKVGEKTHSTFESLLEDFSVSQVFNLSWMAIRDTTDYIVRESIEKWHGKNMFIGAIQRKADRARAEGWEVRHSRRDFNCPQTVVSATFFNLFLKHGDSAFEMNLPRGD